MSLEIEEAMQTSETQVLEIAQSYINICTVYSQMNKHEVAKSYITKAVNLLESEYE